MVDSMGERAIDNSAEAGAVRHLYVHIPFCARICPYCAFYKERADPAQTGRFCEAILAELAGQTAQFHLPLETIFLWRGNADCPNDRAAGDACSVVGTRCLICRSCVSGRSKRIPAAFPNARRACCATTA